jgi:hypothetical protein
MDDAHDTLSDVLADLPKVAQAIEEARRSATAE